MVAISRVSVQFSGSAVVGPSSASFFTTGQPLDFQLPLKALWTALKSSMPSSCTITVPAVGETFDDATGQLIELWTAGTPMVANGGGNEAFARGVGGRLVWNTNGLTNNRRVRGSTFVVPLVAGAYDTDGTLSNAMLSGWNTVVETFVAATSTDFSIWTRPINGAGGKSSGVTGFAIPDKIATLRSRRT